MMRGSVALRFSNARNDPRAREWLTSIYVDYLRELIAVGADYVIHDDGVPEPDFLPYWLDQPFCLPLVAWSDDQPAGFVLAAVRPFPYMDPTSDSHIGEFYVAASYRHNGIGAALLQEVLPRLSGICELSVLNGNQAALAFWRSTLQKCGVAFREEPAAEATTFRFGVSSGP